MLEVQADQNRRLTEALERERPRLRNFIRKHVPDFEDAEDILQDVFSELVQAYRLMKPVEQVGAWMFRVARNGITDLFRKRKPDVSTSEAVPGELSLEDLLPSPNAGPDALFARRVLWNELEAALDELQEEQRFVFVAHEVEGRSFKELSVQTGVGVNTLLARKRYAVLHLRRRLEAIHSQFLKEGRT